MGPDRSRSTGSTDHSFESDNSDTADNDTTRGRSRTQSSSIQRKSVAEAHYGQAIDNPDQLATLQRLEKKYGRRLHGWLDEGMPLEAMGNPEQMEAYRQRKGTPVPWDIDQQNERSKRRNTSAIQRRRRERSTGDTQVPDTVRDVISSAGHSLEPSIQRAMEAKMGDSFDDVRVHTGPTAAQACEDINARAFTVGNHVAFNRGEYDPGSAEGQHVIAHELAHVRQQTGGAVSMLPQDDGSLEVDPDSHLENEAEETAQRVMAGRKLGIQRLRQTDVHIQRVPSGYSAGKEAQERINNNIKKAVKQGGDSCWLAAPQAGLAAAGYNTDAFSQVSKYYPRAVNSNVSIYNSTNNDHHKERKECLKLANENTTVDDTRFSVTMQNLSTAINDLSNHVNMTPNHDELLQNTTVKELAITYARLSAANDSTNDTSLIEKNNQAKKVIKNYLAYSEMDNHKYHKFKDKRTQKNLVLFDITQFGYVKQNQNDNRPFRHEIKNILDRSKDNLPLDLSVNYTEIKRLTGIDAAHAIIILNYFEDENGVTNIVYRNPSSETGAAPEIKSLEEFTSPLRNDTEEWKIFPLNYDMMQYFVPDDSGEITQFDIGEYFNNLEDNSSGEKIIVDFQEYLNSQADNASDSGSTTNTSDLAPSASIANTADLAQSELDSDEDSIANTSDLAPSVSIANTSDLAPSDSDPDTP